MAKSFEKKSNTFLIMSPLPLVVPNVLAALGDLAHRFDADLKVEIGVLRKTGLALFPCLDPFARKGEMGDQKQRADGSFARKTADEKSSGFHLDRQGPLFIELRFEAVVE